MNAAPFAGSDVFVRSDEMQALPGPAQRPQGRNGLMDVCASVQHRGDQLRRVGRHIALFVVGGQAEQVVVDAKQGQSTAGG